MARDLSPRALCNIYTLEQIQAKVDFYSEQLEQMTVRKYDKDTSQGRQMVESQDIDQVTSIMASWVKALECKLGLGKAHIVNGNFRGGPLSRIGNC